MALDVDSYIPTTPLSHAILLALADRSRHGYAIIKEVRRLSGGHLRPRTGTLYTALQRMESEGLIREAAREPSEDDDPRRRYFELTPLGTEVALAESARQLRSLLAAKEKKLLDALDLSGLLGERAP